MGVALLCMPLLWAQHRVGTVSSSVSADTVMIGDQFTLSVEIEKDISGEVGLPQFKDDMLMEKIEVLGQPTVDTLSVDGRSVKLRINYTLTSFDAGMYGFTGFPVVFMDDAKASSGDTVRSASMDMLVVQTFDIDTTKMQIYDIKPQMQTPFIMDEIWDFIARHKWAFIAGGVFALLLAWGIFEWLRRRKRAAKAEKPQLPPHITAMIALEQLRGKMLWQGGKVKEYYSELSDILREYIEGRYGIETMEMTSAEILSKLSKEVECAEKEQRRAKEFFEIADLAKFAKFTPSPVDCSESFEGVSHFVDSTKVLIKEQPQNEELDVKSETNN